MKWKLKHLRLAEDLVLCSSDFLQKTMINKNNWNIYLKAIHVCFCFCWNETNAMGRKSLTRRPNICRLRQIHTDWPTFFSSYNVHIHARAHLPSNCRRKKIMALVRRSTGRRHHWTSLTAFVSRARLSKALDVHGELCSPYGETRAGGKFRAGQIDRIISNRS